MSTRYLAAFLVVALASGAFAEPPVPLELEPSERDTLAWQIALESWGFSPGLLDGRPGLKTRTAIAAAQAASGRPPTGNPDAETAVLLGVDPSSVVRPYQVTGRDVQDIDLPTTDWMERSQRRRLTYDSVSDLLAEKFHTSEFFLRSLNPGRTIEALQPGENILVPATRGFQNRPRPTVRFLEIDLERRRILLIDEDEEKRRFLQGILHCSVAADPDRAPEGDCRIVNVVSEPNYTFNPIYWPEVSGIDDILLIPPGPRNPVGLRWIGLDRSGIGLHGTPEPENVGRTGSHGCFRLTNWDAIWLADVVEPGLPVRIYRRSEQTSWSWGR